MPWSKKQHALFAAACKGVAKTAKHLKKKAACRMMKEGVKK